MKVQTIEGDELVLGGKSYDASGYDYMALIVGSEGMLGVVTEVTVQLLPVPDHQQVLLAAFNELERAGECVAGIISAGLVPAGLEMMDKLAIQAAEEYAGVGYPTDAEAILLCELDGCLEEVEHYAVMVEHLMRSHGAYDVSIAKNKTIANGCGVVARQRFQRQGDLHRTTTVWTERFHATKLAEYYGQ